MPLYELYRLARENLGNETNSTSVADQPSSPENDFFELVWESGQISSQGQSSRGTRKSPSCRSLPSHCLPSHSPRGRDKDVGGGYGTNNNPKTGKFCDLDSGLNEIPMSVPSREVDEMMPWLDYTMDGSFQTEYGSDFLHELTENDDLPSSNNFTLLEKRSNGNQMFRDSHKNSAEQMNVSKDSSAEQVETARHKVCTSQLYPPSSNQCQTSFETVRSGASNITENKNANNGNQGVPYSENYHIPSSSTDFSSLKVQKQDPILPGNVSNVMNFSHFARPAAIVRANLQNIGMKSGLNSASARSDSMGIKNKGEASTSTNPAESTLVNSSGECSKELEMRCHKVVEKSKADLKPLQPKSLELNTLASKQSEPACKENGIKNDQRSNQVLGDGGAKGQTGAEKGMEAAVASSSICSGNGADRGSDDQNRDLKRKSRDTEDSECHSEDVEDESVGVKKGGSGRGVAGSKRSRAAEVHNLSERRRRDRINEKMRALQELIPNCNKVDKASMLDEAIEYLKTLQLQVQMMSMGAGLYMPQMMLPGGMQHMHAPHMAAFSPMGIGMHMGLGMGYGMGMPDMNGGSSRFPMMQMPPQMQGTHIPVAHMSGPSAIHGMARSNPQGFGLPGQGASMPMPRGHGFPFPGGPLMNSAYGSTGTVETVNPASASGSRDPMQNVDSQFKQNTGGRDSTSQIPNQSALVHNGGHASVADDSGAANPGNITL
ncbi:unnamed protein product [Trifolium pratense]|uniref:Uncharacterized protein n=1 Tax=Trifolium pratense TaxID=57577 RepID=A0ACB0IA36_TRIPR|nr:unnamed protein product [Trifolium pratense]